ncbi:hypothetical protein QE400_003059 [Xanthomonas sacchari]|nr:hypothetical protein [Xanthomonas sacchari]
MAFACLMNAIATMSLGWFVGAVIFCAVGFFATRLAVREGGPGRGGVRFGFFAIAMLVMAAAVYGMYLLDTAA